MGGYGSGRRYGWGGKTTTESQHDIDIRWLKQHGYLRMGAMGNLIWSNRGERTGLINYRMIEDGMLLNYRYRKNGGEWQSVEQTVLFDRTPCNYGGHRTWFLCPHCRKRVAVLYGAGKLFLCRNCYGLTYGSQQEVRMDRLMRKARKIRHRLGAGDDLTIPIWQRPKGMHEQTFLRLRIKANSASVLSSKLMLQRLRGNSEWMEDML